MTAQFIDTGLCIIPTILNSPDIISNIYKHVYAVSSYQLSSKCLALTVQQQTSLNIS